MNLVDFLIPANFPISKNVNFGSSIVIYQGEPDFEIPSSTKVAIIGIPEDRFSEGAGEIKSPGAIRKQLYALSSGSPGTVIDLGNLRTGKTLIDTYHGLCTVVSELYRKGIVTLLIGGTIDVFYGNYLAAEKQNISLTIVAPQLRFHECDTEKHPLNALTFNSEEKTAHICNIGYQSYYVSKGDLDNFNDKHFEAYRLGEVRDGDLRGSEPVIRDSDLMAISMNAVKYADAPAASNASPNGFTGEDVCQLAYYAGLSYRCRSLGIFDLIPQNDLQNITVKLAAQMAWYFIEGVKKRNSDNPKDHIQNFKKYLVYFDQLHRSEERRVGKECRSRWSPYH